MKLLNSPTPPVVVIATLIKFLIRQTNTPDTGPKANDAMRAGTSEKSSLMKLGMNGTEKDSAIRAADKAAKIAVYAIYRLLE